MQVDEEGDNDDEEDNNNDDTAASDEFSCDFDAKSLCGITQSTADDFDWTLQAGPTPSGGTGPANGAHSGEYYIYTEASGPRTKGMACVIWHSIHF